MKRWGKREIPEETRRPAASSGTIPGNDPAEDLTRYELRRSSNEGCICASETKTDESFRAMQTGVCKAIIACTRKALHWRAVLPAAARLNVDLEQEGKDKRFADQEVRWEGDGERSRKTRRVAVTMFGIPGCPRAGFLERLQRGHVTACGNGPRHICVSQACSTSPLPFLVHPFAAAHRSFPPLQFRVACIIPPVGHRPCLPCASISRGYSRQTYIRVAKGYSGGREFESLSGHPYFGFPMVSRNHSMRMLGWFLDTSRGRFLPCSRISEKLKGRVSIGPESALSCSSSRDDFIMTSERTRSGRFNSAPRRPPPLEKGTGGVPRTEQRWNATEGKRGREQEHGEEVKMARALEARGHICSRRRRRTARGIIAVRTASLPVQCFDTEEELP
ncbi:hypothetical protein PR048_022285 [Dryococelus australis]|uniref:Uncharacterized protein n=1 Tax=Dryococelus australis TaxID=614101 RepID=A0ABQ9H0N2_9NEOP|nr:hypothetical protein PR048_022285 [Dryococelus australis]